MFRSWNRGDTWEKISGDIERSLTDSRGSRDEDCPNLLRDKPEIRPLRALSSDITYIPTQEGFAYTCTIRDLRSGVVLAEKTASRMKKELVLDTIRSAARSWKLEAGQGCHLPFRPWQPIRQRSGP